MGGRAAALAGPRRTCALRLHPANRDGRADPRSGSLPARVLLCGHECLGDATGYLPFRTHQPLRHLRRGLPSFPAEPDDLSQKNHGGLITWKYPPAYYLLATPAYLLPFLHTDTERLYAVRVLSAVLGAITVWLVFLLLLEARVAPAIALLGTSTYAVLPMVSQASAICNPDVLLMAALAGLAAACSCCAGAGRADRLSWSPCGRYWRH